MDYDTSKLPNDVTELQEMVASLVSKYSDLEQKSQNKINFLSERIRLLEKELFGRKSEKLTKEDRRQLLLFNEAEDAFEPEEEASEEIPDKPGAKKKRGRKPLPDHLPRIDVVHDLADNEKQCDCGHQLSRIGEEVSEKLDIVPAKIQVLRNIRIKYACKHCEGVESDKPTVLTAPVPAQIIPKSNASEGLLAHIVTAKFEDALPLYRQNKIFNRLGIDLSRATMAGWMVRLGESCSPLIELMKSEIQQGPVVNIDETPVQVLKEPGRANTTKSYMWVFRGGPPDNPIVLYQYHPTRSGAVPLEFLKDYQGYIQTDGYQGYDALGERRTICHVGCWAHVRRKFVKVIDARKKGKKAKGGKNGNAEKAVEYIGALYKIEKYARENNLEPEEIYALRQEKAKPILDEFGDWIKARINLTPPQGLLGKALSYTLNQWDRLVRYIDNGYLGMDNNPAENAIRPFVVGRKNWLFSGHPNGAVASATLYSLIETAKANGLQPHSYLRYVFTMLPKASGEEDYKKLLPQYLDKDALMS